MKEEEKQPKHEDGAEAGIDSTALLSCPTCKGSGQGRTTNRTKGQPKCGVCDGFGEWAYVSKKINPR